MRPDHGVTAVDFPAAFAQVINQLFARFQLAARWLVAIEIAHQTNPKRDVVQVVAVDVSALNLPAPAIAHFDFSVASGSPISDDEVISQPVLHSANVTMVVIEDARASLPRAAIVDDDELPSPPQHRRAINLISNRAGKITIGRFRSRP